MAPNAIVMGLVALAVLTTASASSGIEQVIHTGKKALELEMEQLGKQQGGQEQLQAGEAERAAEGERLRDHVDKAHWSREKHGEQRASGAGKKQAQEGDKWVKDAGHKRHGWKNVYHKEEYANHQKYHDVRLDKDWDQKRARQGASYQNDKGERFNDSRSSDMYDKDRHGTKYDYVRGANWKLSDDDHYEAGDSSRADADTDEAVAGQQQVAGRQEEERPGPAYATRRPSSSSAADHFEPSPSAAAASSSSSSDDQVHPADGDGDIDDAAIEQMRDRLNRMSDSTRYSIGQLDDEPPVTEPASSSSQDRNNSVPAYAIVTESPDYEEESVDYGPQNGTIYRVSHNPHQSINDILKTAKRISHKLNGLRGGPVDSAAKMPREGSSSPGQAQEPVTVAPATDDADDEEGQDQEAATERPSPRDNRKNGLRLKLELDLSKAMPARTVAASSRQQRKNQTAGAGQQQLVAVAPNLLPATPRSYQRGSMAHFRSDSGNQSTRQPRPMHYAIPVRAVKIEREPSSMDGRYGSRFVAEEGQRGGGQSPPGQRSRGHPAGSGGWSNAQPPRGNHQQHQQQQQVQQPQVPRLQAGQPYQQQSFQRQPQTMARNFTMGPHALSTLSALSHVIPVRPIFVRHLQMNGGIMLGSKLNGPPSTMNRSLHQTAPPPARHAPLVLPAPGGEDLTIETSLNNAFGDVVTLPGGQQVQVQLQDAESSMAEPEHASRDQQYNMLPYHAEFAHSEGGHRDRDGGGHGPNEPNVIFEVAPGALEDDERPPFMAEAQASNEMESLLTADDQQTLMSMNSDQFAHSAPSYLLESGGSSVYDNAREKQHLMASSEATAAHFKPQLPSALDYATVLLNHAGPATFAGAGAAASIVIPAVQQTFARFLRLPRVFSQVYKQQLPQFQAQLQAASQHHHQFISQPPPPEPPTFQLQLPAELAMPTERQLQRHNNHYYQLHHHLNNNHHHHGNRHQHRPSGQHQLHHLRPSAPVGHLQIEESRAEPSVTANSKNWRRAPPAQQTGGARGYGKHGAAMISEPSRQHRLPARPPSQHLQRYHYQTIETNDLMSAASTKVAKPSVMQPPPSPPPASAKTATSPALIRVVVSPAGRPSNSSLARPKPPVQPINHTLANYTHHQQQPQSRTLEPAKKIYWKRSKRKKPVIINGQRLEYVTVRRPEMAPAEGGKRAANNLTSVFVAPKMQSSNNWIPSSDYFRPNAPANATRLVARATSLARAPDATKTTNQPTVVRPQLQQQRPTTTTGWLDLPYATVGQPKQLAGSGAARPGVSAGKVAATSDQSSAVADDQPPPPPPKSPILSPAAAAAAATTTMATPLATSPITVAPPMALRPAGSTPRAPYFGQRLLASFKSKLNNVGG